MEKIKNWRTERSLTIEAAGALVGVSGVQWHRYENGTRRIPAEKVHSISKVTEIPPHELRPDVFGEPEAAV
ncbi:helix-turn-helix domain-containing protein [Agrobacterium larrymoorei]|uniref:helix-turn-helix domain-containing protein n=1 Tax=Agrobacterium larrymoorei TaxID=160699 RepID=UPI0030C18B1E